LRHHGVRSARSLTASPATLPYDPALAHADYDVDRTIDCFFRALD
jgi:hypothetical protein